MSGNIAYGSDELSLFYRSNRIGWDGIYPSEKIVFDRCGLSASDKVIDMGCACGGLGVALKERYGINRYTGVDINRQCIDLAPDICPWGEFHAADFLDVADQFPCDFDAGFSLSCADWNVETSHLLTSLFSKLKPGGKLVFTCRLTNVPAPDGFYVADQQILWSEKEDGPVEYAPYKVYNLSKILKIISGVGPIAEIYGYGYWGNKPKTVKTLPLERIFYMVFMISKPFAAGTPETRIKFDVSDGLFSDDSSLSGHSACINPLK